MIRSNPNYYLLEDYKNEPIKGRVYEPELAKINVTKDTTYRIEKKIDKRKRKGVIEYLVKFYGYPEFYWLKESDIVN